MTPPKRRWKLWHLLAMVAGSAVLMALAISSPEMFVGLTFVALGIVPPIWAARKLDAPEIESSRSGQEAADEAARSCLSAILFGLGLLVYWPVLFLLLVLLTIVCRWLRTLT